MRIIKGFFLVFLSVLLGATKALADNVDAVNTKGVFNSAAIKGYDAVAYWQQAKPVKGDKQWAYQWRGADWYFSNEENLATFAAMPEKYAPQYGGYCAWAMADGKGRAVNIDPDAWYIYQDKLYLNYNLAVRDEWLKTKDQDIVVADKNYPSFTNVLDYQ